MFSASSETILQFLYSSLTLAWEDNFQPILSTSQTWVGRRHQYGILGLFLWRHCAENRGWRCRLRCHQPAPKVNVVFLGSSPFLIWQCHKQTSINKLHLFEMLYLVRWSWILENVFTSVSDSTLTYFKSFPLKCKRLCTQIKVTVQ